MAPAAVKKTLLLTMMWDCWQELVSGSLAFMIASVAHG